MGRSKIKEVQWFCEGCSRALVGTEIILCGPCALVQIESCLQSRVWMNVRGSLPGTHGRTMAEDFSMEHAQIMGQIEDHRPVDFHRMTSKDGEA